MLYETFFPKLLNISLTGSVVIIAVLLARLLLKRAPKVFSYILWAVALFRLLCPVTLELPVSAVPAGIGSGEILAGWADDYVGDTKTIFPGAEGFDEAVAGRAETVTRDDTDVLYAVTAGDGVSPPQTVYNAWLPVMSIVWLCGMAALLIYSGVSMLLLRRRLVGAARLRDNIFLADHIETPFVMGLFRPKIYLPSALTEREREYIILHEQYHVRRLDHVAKLLAFFCLCVHWFNPLVWLAFSLAVRDMEMSCDEAVLRKMGGEIRVDYSASLLHLATGRQIIAALPLAFGEGDPKSRIKNVLSWKKPAIWVIIAAAVICVAVAILCAVNPKSNEPAGSTPTVPALQVSPPPGASLEAVMPELRSEAIAFSPSDIYDLASAELVLTYGSFKVTGAEPLAWIEAELGGATEVIGGAEGDFTIQLYLTRSDGTVGIVYPADNNWAVKSGDTCYDWHGSSGDELWELFGVDSEHTETEYNDAGEKTKETRYAMNEIRYVMEYEYGEYGPLRTVTTNAGGAISTSEYEYENGLPVRMIYRTNGELMGCTEAEYDDDGDIIKKTSITGDGKVNTVTEVTYDYFFGVKKMSSETVKQGSDDSSAYTLRYEYNELGQKTKTLGYKADGQLNRTEEHEYDAEGRLLRTISYKPDGSVEYRREYVFDGKNTISQLYDGKGNRIERLPTT